MKALTTERAGAGTTRRHRATRMDPDAVIKSVRRFAVAGIIVIGGGLASTAVAAAEPPPPIDPAIPVLPTEPPAPDSPPGASIGSPLTQRGQVPGGGLSGGLTDPTALLDPTKTLGAPPTLNPWNNQYLLPQYESPSAPGSNAPLDGIAPGDENANVGVRQFLSRVHSQYRDGNLDGGFLGQRPEASLGEPLPGTAPPPGTNLPPGLDEFQPDPVDPIAPPPPGVLPPPLDLPAAP